MFVGLFVLTNIYATCNKRLDCDRTVYSFEGNFTASPDEDSIQLNDTIFLELAMPTTLKNVPTNQIVDFGKAVNLGTNISFDKLQDNNGDVQFCADCFELKLIHGSFVPDDLLPDRNKDYLFEETDSQYIFKLAIIPKATGTFCFAVGNATNVYTSKNKCDKAGFSLTFKNTSQHLYLYEQSRPGYTVSDYEKTHMYCFKVY